MSVHYVPEILRALLNVNSLNCCKLIKEILLFKVFLETRKLRPREVTQFITGGAGFRVSSLTLILELWAAVLWCFIECSFSLLGWTACFQLLLFFDSGTNWRVEVAACIHCFLLYFRIWGNSVTILKFEVLLRQHSSWF